MNGSARRRYGFSLVELLVAIVIVIVLAALSFLITGRIQTKARTASSINNLRQLGTTAQIVASELNGVLPITTWDNQTQGTTLLYWWDPLATHLYDTYNYATGPQRDRRISGLFRDPASHSGRRISPDEMRPAKWKEIDYVVWAPNQKNWNRQIRGTRLAELSNASMQPYLTTGSMETGAYPAVTTESLFNQKVLPYASWHDGKVIVLYCDGSLATVANPTFESVAPLMARQNP